MHITTGSILEKVVKEICKMLSYPYFKGKLMESAVKETILKHIEDEQIWCARQSGPGYRHSFLMNNLKEVIDNNEFVITVFLDFKRTFETVDYIILRSNLGVYGVKDLNQSPLAKNQLRRSYIWR